MSTQGVVIEFGVLRRRCLNLPILDQEALRLQVAAWQLRRNSEVVNVDWRFTPDDALVEFRR